MKKYLLLFSALVLTVSMWATKYTPLPGENTIKAVVDGGLQDGDVIELANGSYTESNALTFATKVTIKAAENAKVSLGIYDLKIQNDFEINGIDVKNISKDNYLFHVNAAVTGTIAFKNCSMKVNDEVTSATPYIYVETTGQGTMIIDNCVFSTNTKGQGSVVYAGTKTITNFTMTNSTVYGCPTQCVYCEKITNALVDQCTFYNNAGQILYIKGTLTSCVVKNCIFTAATSITDNCIKTYGGSVENCIYYNLSEPRAGVTILKCESADPKFKAPANLDFSLQVGSPAIGAGTDGQTIGDPRWAELSPDMHDFLYFVGLNGNDTVRLNKVGTSTTLANLTATFEYSKDRINWTPYDTWGAYTPATCLALGTPIALAEGDTVFFRAKGTKGLNATMSNGNPAYFNFAFGADDQIAAGGNIMSLYDATCEQDTMTMGGFYYLFNDAKQLVSAPKLPATKLERQCYSYLLSGCTSLTQAPELKATTLAISCYQYMFQNCTALTSAPELKATTMEKNCYCSMFSGCTSLTQAPELKATTLAITCYSSMFNLCTALTQAPELKATTLEERCYQMMFQNCTALTQAPELKATTLANGCYNSMFKGCTALEIDTCTGSCDGVKFEPTTTGTTPTDWNKNMFNGCKGDTALTATYGIKLGGHYCIKEYVDTLDYLHFVSLKDNGTVRLNKWSYFGATSLANLTATFEYSKDRINWTAYDTWGEATSIEASDGYFAFGNSIALNQGDTVFFRAKGTNGKNATMSNSDFTYFYFAFGVDDSIAAGGNIMSLYDATCEQDTMTRVGFCGLFKDAKQLVSAPELPATTLEYGCYNEMFFGCTSLTTAPALPATTLANSCYMGMFNGCTSLTQAPELKATTMTSSCYNAMFQGCTSLTTAPALPATILNDGCYSIMFYGCTALTQAPELKATTLAMMCYNQMFQGCTSLQVDTCADDETCTGALLVVPNPASEPTRWNQNMFAGCHGDAKYTAEYGIKLGGKYCIKEFIPDTIKGIELIAVDTIYDGQNHYIQVNGTIEGDAVTYSTDSATWKQDTIKLKNVAEQTVYVRIQRTDHIDWYGKSSIKIAKKELTVDSTTVADKTYDGKTDATMTGSKLVGVVKGESVGLDVRGNFDNKNAGTNIDVTVEYRLEGSEVVISNYTLQKESETLKGTITPKTLTVTGTTASEKEYDGNTTASVTAGTLSGVVESDDVQIDTSTGAFEDKNAGESKNVITTYTLRGADSDNYSTPTDTILANITPKPLTISGTTIADKTYDGMIDAVVDTLGIVEGIVAGDTVKVTATAYFNDKDAGEGKNAFVEYSVEGEGYTNYQAPQASYHTANINKRPITITSGSAMKVFDNMPLTNNKVEVTEGSWAEDEGASLDAKGSQTQVGSCPNSFDITCYANTDESNYDITKVEGTLTVKDYGTCAEANATPVDEVLGLKPVVVTYVNNAYTYAKDSTGASLIYADGYGLIAGDQVTGFVGESAPDEYGLPRIFPSKKSSELTIVAGAAPEPELRTATPTMNEIHQYVRYENVKIGSALLTPATPVEATLNNGDQIMLNSKFGSSYMIEGGEDITYDIVAIVGVRDEVMELYPTVIAVHTSVNLSDVNADNRVVEKYILNGQLYIRVNGVVYDAAGNRM